MKKIPPKNALVYILVTGLLLLLAGCSTETEHRLKQDERYWLTFDTQQVSPQAQELSWQFELNRAGKYDIQVLSDVPNVATDTHPIPDVEIWLDDKKISSELKHGFQINSGNNLSNIFVFDTAHEFSTAGIHSLTLKTNSSVKQIRLVPNYKNVLGSGEFLQQWSEMHGSAPKQATLKWFKEARFGMFIHWGLYSGAAGNWKGTTIEESHIPGPKVAEWLMYKFQISRAEYAELAKSFKPDKSFAQNIARLAKDVGMKYVIITTKHHDGFALFDSKVSAFDVVDASPYEGDLIKELYDAVRSEGLEFGVYYSHGNDWADGSDGNYAKVKAKNDALGIYTHAQGKNLWDPSNNSHSDYLHSKAYPQIAELINLLPELRVLWFDGDGLITEQQAFDFYKLVYDMNPNILVNRRVGYEFGDYLDAGDNVIPSAKDNLSKHWETAGTTNNSWGYNDHDHNWKSTKEMLYYFIDITSKGGNYLLNVGPDGQGNVPATSALRLREMGEWIKTNSDAIYGTQPWQVQSEGQEEDVLKGTSHRAEKGFSRTFSQQDFWFTARDNKVYAMSLVQAEGKVAIKSLNANAADIKSVKLLGTNEMLSWQQTAESLELDFSEIKTSENGYAIEVLLK
nr:GH29 fucosidase [uncultured bacterium]